MFDDNSTNGFELTTCQLGIFFLSGGSPKIRYMIVIWNTYSKDFLAID